MEKYYGVVLKMLQGYFLGLPRQKIALTLMVTRRETNVMITKQATGPEDM
jgi:hypothetical protein